MTFARAPQSRKSTSLITQANHFLNYTQLVCFGFMSEIICSRYKYFASTIRFHVLRFSLINFVALIADLFTRLSFCSTLHFLKKAMNSSELLTHSECDILYFYLRHYKTAQSHFYRAKQCQNVLQKDINRKEHVEAIKNHGNFKYAKQIIRKS